MATLPGEDKAEFLLMMPFTPRNKDNLIGLMVARCDGPNLGDMVVLQLSKQELIFGPMQITARINQDQTISKDLTLWNQQGSHVLRGQTLVLPVGNTFLYVDPIYIQATEAQHAAVEEGGAGGGQPPDLHRYLRRGAGRSCRTARRRRSSRPAEPPQRPPAAAGAQAGAPPPAADPRIQSIRQHLQRYRELAAQGHWSEAGKELEAIEAEAKK